MILGTVCILQRLHWTIADSTRRLIDTGRIHTWQLSSALYLRLHAQILLCGPLLHAELPIVSCLSVCQLLVSLGCLPLTRTGDLNSLELT